MYLVQTHLCRQTLIQSSLSFSLDSLPALFKSRLCDLQLTESSERRLKVPDKNWAEVVSAKIFHFGYKAMILLDDSTFSGLV